MRDHNPDGEPEFLSRYLLVLTVDAKFHKSPKRIRGIQITRAIIRIAMPVASIPMILKNQDSCSIFLVLRPYIGDHFDPITFLKAYVLGLYRSLDTLNKVLMTCGGEAQTPKLSVGH